MGEITDDFKTVYRDFVVDGVPASGAKKPVKAEIRALGKLIDDSIEGAAAGLVIEKTWAELAANPGTRNGQPGQVTTDAGTHTDPVVGGTVANEGLYSWSVSPAGWRWAGPDDIARLETDVAALEIDVAALDTRVDDHAELLSEVFESVATLQVAGTPQTPVSGTALSNLTYVFGTPVAANGFLTRVKGFGLNGGGTLRIKRFTRAGDVFTHVATYPVTVPAGAFSLDFEDFVNTIPVVAGEYLGVYAWNGASILAQTVGGTPDTPVYSNSAVGGETTTTFTDASLGTGTRFELSLTVGNATVSEARLAALEVRVDGHADVLDDVFYAVAGSQIVGNTETPVSGTALSDSTYVFEYPVAADGFLTKLEGFGLNGGGTLKFKRFTRAGDVFTHVATWPVTVSAGAWSRDVADFGVIPVVAGEYLGVYAWNGASILGQTVAGKPDTKVWSGAGEVTTSFTDTTLSNGLRVELRFTVGAATVSEARLATVEDKIALAIEAIRTLVEETANYSPAIAFLTYDGAWYDFSDKSTLFVDTAGTTPVTAGGNLIGYVRDKSGNGYHYKAASDGVRGSYQTNVVGARGVGRFGTGKYLTGVKAGLLNDIGKISVFAVVKFASTTFDQAIIEHMVTGSTSVVQILFGTSSTRPGMAARQTTAGASVSVQSHRGILTDEFVLLEGVADYAGGKVNFFDGGRNMVEGAKLFLATQNSEDFNDGASYIAGNPAASDSFTGDICEIVEIVGSVDDVTRAGIYSYLSSRWGNIPVDDLGFYNPTGLLPGIWTWFNDPRAILYSTNVFLVGGMSGGGSVMAAKYDYTGGPSGAIDHVVLYDRMQIDDHDNPGFVKLADNHVLAFYTTHGIGGDEYWMQKTTTPGVLTAWNARVNIGAQIKPGGNFDRLSYANVVRLSAESNKLYLIARAEDLDIDDESWFYSTSTDNGVNWAIGKILWNTDQRPYTKICQNGNARIDFAFNDGHPGEQPTNNLYHCYLTGGNFYKSDGTLIGSEAALPIDIATGPTKVYDAAASGFGRSWIWDVTFDPANNRPVICFAVFPSPAFTDHRYRQARFNGTTWSHSEICAAGGELIANQDAYSGGVITDPQNPNIVYASRGISGVFQLFKYVSADSGVTWTGTQLTTGTVNCFRPFIPAGGRKLFYCRGDYGPDYFNIDTEIVAMDIV